MRPDGRAALILHSLSHDAVRLLIREAHFTDDVPVYDSERAELRELRQYKLVVERGHIDDLGFQLTKLGERVKRAPWNTQRAVKRR